MPSGGQHIVFFHPDLGIGGAERLVIDAATGLQKLGHKVTIFTSHCDRNHCFDEARDGTLDVRVRGDTIFPATFLGRFKILLSILRQYHLLVTVTRNGELRQICPTAFFVDQLSAAIPLLRFLWSDVRILFYCHFPDMLLVKGRDKWIRRVWRMPFDWLEGWTMKGADRVIANSNFTKKIVQNQWKALGGKRGIGIVYPCVDTNTTGEKDNELEKPRSRQELWNGRKVILSINRFEQKKNVGLALRAFANLEVEDRKRAILVIAGGYDHLVRENVKYKMALEAEAGYSLGLQNVTTTNIVTALDMPNDVEVTFLLSMPSQVKSMLLNAASLLVYTPSEEHFGIVPLEAMLAGVPVLAANSGGPLETVIEGSTGWLRPVEDLREWTKIMRQVLVEMTESQLQQMGRNGINWVRKEFSKVKMSRGLDEEISQMIKTPRADPIEIKDLLMILGVLTLLIPILIAYLYGTREKREVWPYID